MLVGLSEQSERSGVDLSQFAREKLGSLNCALRASTWFGGTELVRFLPERKALKLVAHNNCRKSDLKHECRGSWDLVNACQARGLQ